MKHDNFFLHYQIFHSLWNNRKWPVLSWISVEEELCHNVELYFATKQLMTHFYCDKLLPPTHTSFNCMIEKCNFTQMGGGATDPKGGTGTASKTHPDRFRAQ